MLALLPLLALFALLAPLALLALPDSDEYEWLLKFQSYVLRVVSTCDLARNRKALERKCKVRLSKHSKLRQSTPSQHRAHLQDASARVRRARARTNSARKGKELGQD